MSDWSATLEFRMEVAIVWTLWPRTGCSPPMEMMVSAVEKVPSSCAQTEMARQEWQIVALLIVWVAPCTHFAPGEERSKE